MHTIMNYNILKIIFQNYHFQLINDKNIESQSETTRLLKQQTAVHVSN